jgi:hypothetical protein
MCVLRAKGKDFDVDLFLQNSPIEPCAVYRRGEPRLPGSQPQGPTCEASGFNATVSMKEWDDLGGQIADAKLFLTSHRAELDRLRSFAGVEGLEIDFPIPLRIGRNDVAVQCEHFPADLILAAGSLGIDLAFSIWPPARPSSEDGGTAEQADEPADPAAATS